MFCGILFSVVAVRKPDTLCHTVVRLCLILVLPAGYFLF